MKITINTAENYDIHLGTGLLSEGEYFNNYLTPNDRVMIVTDHTVGALYGAKIQKLIENKGATAKMLQLPPGEKTKTRETKQWIEDELLGAGFGRDTVIIALGGGVITDLAGFVAATYCRGVPVMYMPTTLLAMVDACIGGKTGVNTPHGKNLIGTFTQPRAVYIDTDTLTTLSDDEFKNGLVEMIKHALIGSASLFDDLITQAEQIKNKEPQVLKHIIAESCKIKARIVEQDEFEQTGKREMLNLGHTIGHAIEQASDYGIPHGEAVGIGIYLEGLIAVELGLLKVSTLDTILQLFTQYNINYKPQGRALTKEKIVQALSRDKKAKDNKPMFVMLEEIGKTYQRDQKYSISVPSTLIQKVLEF